MLTAQQSCVEPGSEIVTQPLLPRTSHLAMGKDLLLGGAGSCWVTTSYLSKYKPLWVNTSHPSEYKPSLMAAAAKGSAGRASSASWGPLAAAEPSGS